MLGRWEWPLSNGLTSLWFGPAYLTSTLVFWLALIGISGKNKDILQSTFGILVMIPLDGLV